MLAASGSANVCLSTALLAILRAGRLLGTGSGHRGKSGSNGAVRLKCCITVV